VDFNSKASIERIDKLKTVEERLLGMGQIYKEKKQHL
jgi:hypothetical protein